jgi:hypothetical protein
MTRTYRRPGGLAILVAAAAIGLAACSGGPSSPHVASLGRSTTGSGNGTGRESSTAPQPKGNPTQLLDEWAACMRRHGDTGQADPTIGANNVIDITWTPSIPGGVYGTNKGGQGNSGPGQYCRAYLNAAQLALQGGRQPAPPDLAKVVKYAECIRANGVPDFPDPSTAGGGVSFNMGSANPNNPTFQNASRLCAKKTGVRALGVGPPPPGTIELNGQAGP